MSFSSSKLIEKYMKKKLPSPKKRSIKFIILPAVFLIFLPSSYGLHIQGTWSTDTDFFLFLSKFSFQKTEVWNKNDTQGYIFGNLTSFNNKYNINNYEKNEFNKKESSFNSANIKILNKRSSDIKTNNVSTISVNHPSSSSSSSTTPKNEIFSNNNKTSTTVKNISLSNNLTTLQKPTTKPFSNNNSKPIPSLAQSSSTTTTTIKPSIKNETKIYPGTLVVLDKSYFVNFYRNRNLEDKDEACKQMFEQISAVMYDSRCFPNGKEFPIRRVPCPINQTCLEEVNPMDIVKGYQFTYAISDKTQAKFWYVSFVACYLDQECKWKHNKQPAEINYDMWLVNGNPYTKNQNPLEYQFSFDHQDTVEIYLVFFVCYLVLVPLQVHAVLRQKHIVPRLFTLSVMLELTSTLSNVIHVLTFSIDGVGWVKLAVFGDIMDILARAIFMLILLVLAKGWAVTRQELKSKPFIFTIWAIYSIIHILLYIWKETEVDVIEDIDEYQTNPGWIILIFRTIIMLWFIYELKDTMAIEHQPYKLNFFLHFGAAALVWFIYLPIVALIALQLSPLWRYKFLLGVTYSADCLAFAVMTHLLWPTRSKQYFLLSSNRDLSIREELEEFNEAPQMNDGSDYFAGRRRGRRWYPVNYYFRKTNSMPAETFSLYNDQAQTNGHVNHNHQIIGNGLHNSDSYIDDKDSSPLIIT